MLDLSKQQEVPAEPYVHQVSEIESEINCVLHGQIVGKLRIKRVYLLRVFVHTLIFKENHKFSILQGLHDHSIRPRSKFRNVWTFDLIVP